MNILIDSLLMQFFYTQNRKMCLSEKILYQSFVVFLPCLGQLLLSKRFICNYIRLKLLRNFIEITLRHGCSPVNLLHIFRTPFTKNTSGWLLLLICRPLHWCVEIQYLLFCKMHKITGHYLFHVFACQD